MATGRELPKTGVHSRLFVTFSPDSSLLVTAGAGLLHVYEATTGKQLYQVGGQHASRPWATFSSDGKFLATQEGDGISSRETATGKERFRLKHQYHARFSPDGKLLATAGPDAAVCLWEAATGQEVRRLTGQQPPVTSVAFSPDGKFLIFGAAHERGEVWIHLWEVATGKERHQFRNAGYPVFSPDGKVLALRGRNGLHLWDLAADRELHTLKESAGYSAAAFSPDSKTLATAEGSFGVRLWDVAAGQEVLARPAAGGLAAVFSPDGKVLATAGRSIQLWDPATGKELLRLEARDRVSALAWSADGRTLAAAGTGRVYLWDLAFPPGGPPQASNRREADAHQGKPFALAFSPDGKLLASAGEDQALVLWDAAAGKPVRRVTGRVGRAPSVAFSADGKDVFTASTEVLASLRGVATGKEALTYQDPSARWAGLPADGRVVAWDHNGTVFLRETSTGKPLAEFESPRGTMPVRLAPDGRLLAYVDPSGIVRLCETASGREVFHFSTPPTHLRIQALSPDGKALAMAGWYGDVLVWDLVPGGWDAARGPGKLGPGELDRLWRDLGGDDAAAAYRAAWALVAARQKVVPFLKDLLRPAEENQGERGIRKLIADLDADAFAVRESASKELIQHGPAVAPLLRQSSKGRPPRKSAAGWRRFWRNSKPWKAVPIREDSSASRYGPCGRSRCWSGSGPGRPGRCCKPWPRAHPRHAPPRRLRLPWSAWTGGHPPRL